jgi:hypothetical protein
MQQQAQQNGSDKRSNKKPRKRGAFHFRPERSTNC